jgi:LmbE family N-acetylglucosaminyl deacetylase
MRRRSARVFPLSLAAALAAATVLLPAQLRLRPITADTGNTAVQLQLRRLHTTGTLMMTTAHPDDENNGLLARMAHGLGLRTVLVTATRGDGGQNEIGPEIFDALAVLRTEELLAAHKFDGAEQYFTRAVDFGYSFSLDQTYEKWGRDAIIGDFVRHIRTIRPDVIAGFLWTGTNGGLHHQASTHLAADAFRAAADPARYPEQIALGLRPWQPAKFYYLGGFGGGSGQSFVEPDLSHYDPVLDRTYGEIGTEARTMHRCQDVSQLLPLPGGGRGGGYHLQDCVIPGQMTAHETSLLDGLDLSVPGLARFAGPSAPAALGASLQRIAQSVDDADRAFQTSGASATVAPLAAGLHAVRDLRRTLASLNLGDTAAYEIDFRLAQKEREFQDALLAAASVRVDAIGDDGMVTPGQAVNVSLYVDNKGEAPITLGDFTLAGSAVKSAITAAGRGGRGGGETARAACASGEIAAGTARACQTVLPVPLDAKPSDVPFRHDPSFARYIFDADVPFGAPFRPTPFLATARLTIGGEPVERTLPIEARSGSDMIAGEKRSELLVVPSLTVTLSPGILVVPTGRASDREVRVTVRNNSRTEADADVRLTLPAGWTSTPALAHVTVARTDEEATARFILHAPAGLQASAVSVSAVAVSGGAEYGTGFQVIEYPHIRKRLLFHPAEASVKVVDVKVAPGLTVGYVMGAGDQVPAAIAQLGVPVTLLGPVDLAWGDLSAYSVIMTGVRAYENRPDLRANNQRLMDYVRRGGVVLVNYNRTGFNDAQSGPYPAETTSNRITDENAPVRVLVPTHPVFTTPNRIGPDAWAHWVQERGTYFLGQRAPQYTDLIEMTDPFPNNPGPKRGALVEARLGQGRWLYIGLVLWRELPAGVPGAYQLLANLLSLGAAR